VKEKRVSVGGEKVRVRYAACVGDIVSDWSFKPHSPYSPTIFHAPSDEKDLFRGSLFRERKLYYNLEN